MRITGILKEGAKNAPSFLIFLYFLFILLDLVSTYLGTPDLKYEGNYIVKLLDLNWPGFILIYLISAVIAVSGLLISTNYLHKYFSENRSQKSLITEFFSKKRLIIYYILYGIFYGHLINIGHILINNFFVSIYIHFPDSFLYNTSINYLKNQKIIILYMQTLPIVYGYVIAFFVLEKIKSSYLDKV